MKHVSNHGNTEKNKRKTPWLGVSVVKDFVQHLPDQDRISRIFVKLNLKNPRQSVTSAAEVLLFLLDWRAKGCGQVDVIIFQDDTHDAPARVIGII